MSMETLESSPSHVSTKVLVKSYGNPSVGHISKTWTTSYGHQLDGDEIFNVPFSCYIVNWRNRTVAITRQVQLSNLISSYNGNKK